MAIRPAVELNSTVRLLCSIWEKEIRTDYEAGLIPNEGSLQAALYHHIRRKGLHGVEVFAVVKTFLNGKGIPDLIVAKDLHVEAVMELKVQKGTGGIVYESDVDKLMGWSGKVTKKSEQKDWLRINPYSMHFEPYCKSSERAEYTLNDRTAWIFAAIGKNYCDGLDRRVLGERISMRLRNSVVRRAFKRSFLHFTGIVYKDPKRIEFVAGPRS